MTKNYVKQQQCSEACPAGSKSIKNRCFRKIEDTFWEAVSGGRKAEEGSGVSGEGDGEGNFTKVITNRIIRGGGDWGGAREAGGRRGGTREAERRCIFELTKAAKRDNIYKLFSASGDRRRCAGLAQPVERLIRNHEVASSNLASSFLENSEISRFQSFFFGR